MFYWILFILIEVYRNYRLIEVRKQKPNYAGSFIIRAFFGLVCLVIMYPDFDPLGDYTTLWDAAPVAVFEVTSFYLLFDPLLNLSRGKPLFYQGKNSGWLDKLGKGWHYALKLACLVFLVLSLIIIK